MSSLARLADEREVIFWDQLGCGNSERPSDTGLWTMERSVAEMDAVVQALGLNRFHIFGNSWGGMLAQQYALDATSECGQPHHLEQHRVDTQCLRRTWSV